jgi:hypothetical protein
MSPISARILGAAATAALVIVPVATAGPAAAATRVTQRPTMAMALAEPVAWFIEVYTQEYRLDGRSTRAMRAAIEITKDVNHSVGFTLIKVSGLSDRNRDGLDDDAKVALRSFDNVAILTLNRKGTVTVTDGGFVFKNRLSVLKESAQSFDRVLRAAAPAEGQDPWDMSLIKEVKAEMPPGVRVVSDYDGNRDGYDDDGRLTFLARGKAVTLTIGNTGRQAGKVTYGPTWKAKAPRRTHHPVAPARRG